MKNKTQNISETLPVVDEKVVVDVLMTK